MSVLMASLMQLTKPQFGYTLVECLVALAIVSVLTSMAVPSFRQLHIDAQQRHVIHQLEAAVSAARHWALTEGVLATLCGHDLRASPDLQTPVLNPLCAEHYSTGAAVWLQGRQGWRLRRAWDWEEYVVRNRSGSREAGEQIVFSPGGLANRNMTWSTCAGGANLSLVLNRIGRPISRKNWGQC